MRFTVAVSTARLIVGVGVVGLVLAGCSSADESTGVPSAVASQTPRSSTPVPPDPETDAAAPQSITFTTNAGEVVVKVDPKAPRTVASMAKLAGDGFFDGTICHRLVTDGIFVLQCGDPTGTGTGGPGYTVPDENLPAEKQNNYPAGTVAMANAGPGTTGSQFFLVYKDTTLPSGYTVWGKITEGLDVVSDIAAKGTDSGATDGAPKETVTIESATAQSG